MANLTTYSDTDKARGLQVLAMHGGNARHAEADLAELGHPIPASTLRGWRRQEPKRYVEIRRTVLDHVYADISDDVRELGRKSIRAAEAFIDQAEQLREAGEYAKAKQMTAAAKDLAVINGIGLDKAFLIDQRPTEIRGQAGDVDLYSFLKKLERHGAIAKGSINPALTAADQSRFNGSPPIESTAEEED
jgi:hypothetical protein